MVCNCFDCPLFVFCNISYRLRSFSGFYSFLLGAWASNTS